jgi:CRP/FNR family transcriptional regulator, cyclic AMP receptor protein
VHPLSGISVFRSLPEPVLDRLWRASATSEPPSGFRLITQGDPADVVFAILSGEGYVRVGAADRRGKSLMLAVFRAGDIVGEMGVIEGMPRTADVVTDGRVRLARIAGPVFMSVLEEFPPLGVALCRTFSERLRRTSVLLEDASFETLEVRLARQLLYLAAQSGRPSETGLQLRGRFRQSDLADMLGATTRSIITILQAWRALGILQFDGTTGRLTIMREDQLRGLIER